MKRVLVTGGAGFIGSHLCDHLLAMGCEVMAYDCLVPQVHKDSPSWPDYRVPAPEGDSRATIPWVEQPGLTIWFGDVRDQRAIMDAMMQFQPDAVVHLAARVGVGQGDEQIANYASANVTGTAVLLNAIKDFNRLVDHRAESLALLAEDQEVTPQVTEVLDLEPHEMIKAGDEWLVPDAGEWQTIHEDHDYLDTMVGPDLKVRRPVYETQEEADARYEAWRIETQAQVEALPDSKVEQVFTAGSMSSYGEGNYTVGQKHNASVWRGRTRRPEEMDAGNFSAAAADETDVLPERGWGAVVRGIPETADLRPRSVYASTKAEQERLTLIVGKAHGIRVTVGRFFNCYGPRQALGNPYTGVGAIFAARALAGLAPRVYEDGKQSRDFIHVDDLCRGIIAIMERGIDGGVYNVGTGKATTILALAQHIAQRLDAPEPEVTGEWRVGDVRHCIADATDLCDLGWTPQVSIEDGVDWLCEWVKTQPQPENLDAAHNDLKDAGLLRGGVK